MKKIYIDFFTRSVMFFSQRIVSQEVMDVKKFQDDLNEEYLNPKTTPLRGDNFKNFKEHPFFPFDLKYRITAKFVKTKDPKPFDLPTSSGKQNRTGNMEKLPLSWMVNHTRLLYTKAWI